MSPVPGPQSQAPDLFYAFGLSPKEAIEYFRSKGYEISWDWFDVWQEAHAKAFTVAKVMKMDVLQVIRGSVQKSLDEGLPLAQFKKDLMPQIARLGWNSQGVDPDTLRLADPRRLRTIYETNMQTALEAGRYKSFMSNINARPYAQYVRSPSVNKRDDHVRLYNLVFPLDDPFWDTHWPPNGFG